MHTVRKLLDRCIEAFACLMFAMMLFVSTWQIVSRYVFQDPIIFSEEFLRYSLVWLSLVGLAYANGKTAHITLDFLTDLPEETLKRLAIFSQLMVMFFAVAVMIGGGLRATSLAARQVSPVLGISMSWVYLALPVSGALTVIYGLLNLFSPSEHVAASADEVRADEELQEGARQGESHAV